MPKVPTDYSKTCIYKLVHQDDINNENIYIGSTTNFRKRKNQHKSLCHCETDKGYNYPKYQYIRENGGWDMWKMIEIEKYPCNDKREAERRERYWVEYYQSKLNRNIPYTNDAEKVVKKQEIQQQWYINNRSRVQKLSRDYYHNNKTMVLEKKRTKIRCVCGCEVVQDCLVRHQRSVKHQKLMEQLNEAI